jgi:hypothetical protein
MKEGGRYYDLVLERKSVRERERASSIVVGEVLTKGRSRKGDVVSKRELDQYQNRFIEAGAQAK